MMGVKIGAAVAVVSVPAMMFVIIIGLVLFQAAGAQSSPVGEGGGLLAGSVPGDYAAYVDQAGTRCPEISPALIAAQLGHESSFNPRAVSPVGAEGIAQFMPSTWRIWGKDYSGDGVADIWNAQDAIGSQADYMCGLVSMIKSWINQGRVSGDVVQLALAGYNAGPDWILRDRGMPPDPETRNYVSTIIAAMPQFIAPEQEAGSKQVETAIAAAEAQDHARYVFGADGPDAWDCSSLMQHAWQAAGVQLPRTTFEQVKSPLLQQVPWQDRRRGDLIYFHIDGGALPDHVGMALSDRLMIHASHPHPDPEDDIVEADYTTSYYLKADPIVMRVVTQ